MSDQHPKPSADGKSIGPPPLPANWSGMNGDEKYEYLSTAWASTEGKSFASAEIGEAYRRRAQRWLDVVTLRKPDRVPDYFCAGVKRATYVMYMEPKIDAKTALEWGLIHEIVEHEKLMPRAYEIARHIMKTDRSVRRLMHEIAIRPWKRALQDDERVHVLAEMYAVQLLSTRHNFNKIAADFEADRPQFKKD